MECTTVCGRRVNFFVFRAQGMVDALLLKNPPYTQTRLHIAWFSHLFLPCSICIGCGSVIWAHLAWITWRDGKCCLILSLKYCSMQLSSNPGITSLSGSSASPSLLPAIPENFST